jgi:hypothetical protein
MDASKYRDLWGTADGSKHIDIRRDLQRQGCEQQQRWRKRKDASKLRDD